MQRPLLTCWEPSHCRAARTPIRRPRSRRQASSRPPGGHRRNPASIRTGDASSMRRPSRVGLPERGELVVVLGSVDLACEGLIPSSLVERGQLFRGVLRPVVVILEPHPFNPYSPPNWSSRRSVPPPRVPPTIPEASQGRNRLRGTSRPLPSSRVSRRRQSGSRSAAVR